MPLTKLRFCSIVFSAVHLPISGKAHPVSGLAYDRRLTYGEPNNDLVAIGASGFSFIAMVIGVHRGWIARHEAFERPAMMLSMLEKATR